MATAVNLANSALDVRKRHGRAVNAVAAYLRNKLHIPNVYIEPKFTTVRHVDVLAVDRAGSGDLHAAEIKVLSGTAPLSQLEVSVRQLKDVPTHYKYLVLSPTPKINQLANRNALFSSDGIGRIGILLLVQEGNALPRIELLVEPERFRVETTGLEKIEKYLSKAKPDMFVRI
jgi:hypothetical protein